MKTDRRTTRVCTALLIANLMLIWGNSLLSGEVSGTISGFVTEILGKLLGMSPGESQSGHGLLRKIAHFSEFACFGALLAWRLRLAGRGGEALISQTLLGGLLTACADETIQRFVPGRASSVLDVWIDFSGAAVGLAVLILGYHFYVIKKQNKILEET